MTGRLGAGLLVVLLWGCSSAPNDDGIKTSSSQTTGNATAGTRPELIVSSSGDGKFTSIMEAIKVARDGDTIRVRKGTYREPLAIAKPLTIIGEGQLGEVVIQTAAAVSIRVHAKGGRISNLTVCGAGGESDAISINGGDLLIEDCEARVEKGGVLGVAKGAAVALRRARLSGGTMRLAYVEGAMKAEDSSFCGGTTGLMVTKGGKATLLTCSFSESKDCGLRVEEGGSASAQECVFSANGGHGVYSKGASIEVYDGKVTENGKNGVFISAGAKGLVQGCDICGAETPLVGAESGSTLTLRTSKLHGGNSNGLSVRASEALVEDCDVFCNRNLPAVGVWNGANATFRRCRIYQNEGFGVTVKEKSNVTIEDCEVNRNGDIGIAIRTGAVVVIRNSRFNHNAEYAVGMSGGSRATIEKSDLCENAKGAWLIEEDCRSLVTRSENKIDATPNTLAKVGDWAAYRFRVQAGQRTSEFDFRVAVTARTEHEITLEMNRKTGAKEEVKTIVEQIGSKSDFVTSLLSQNSEADVKEVDKGNETIRICGRDLSCERIRYAIQREAGGKMIENKATVWASPIVPINGVAKLELQMNGGPGGNGLVTLELTGYGRATDRAATETQAPPPVTDAVTEKPITKADTAPAVKANKKPVAIYVLKDGRHISAEKVVDAGVEVSIKDMDGEFHLVRKGDIVRTE